MSHFTGFGAYLLFLALRTHFAQDKYDFFQNRGKLRANRDSFNKRHDKHFFNTLAKTYDTETLKDFYIANILEDKHYVAEMVDEQADFNLMQYKKRRQSLHYVFENDVNLLLRQGPREPFRITLEEYPPIIILYLQKRISHESMVIINDLMFYVEKFDKYIGEDDPIWPKIAQKVQKYKPFIKYDKDRCKHILREKIDETRYFTR